MKDIDRYTNYLKQGSTNSLSAKQLRRLDKKYRSNLRRIQRKHAKYASH